MIVLLLLVLVDYNGILETQSYKMFRVGVGGSYFIGGGIIIVCTTVHIITITIIVTIISIIIMTISFISCTSSIITITIFGVGVGGTYSRLRPQSLGGTWPCLGVHGEQRLDKI